MNLNIFGGIIIGLIVYRIHKKAIDIKILEIIEFFSEPQHNWIFVFLMYYFVFRYFIIKFDFKISCRGEEERLYSNKEVRRKLELKVLEEYEKIRDLLCSLLDPKNQFVILELSENERKEN